MNNENKWVAIPGFPKYFASKDGEIKSFYDKHKPPKILSNRIHKGEAYPRVSLMTRSGRFKMRTHNLIALTFLGECEGKWVLHKNGNPSDNRVSNLYYGTQKENYQDSLRHKTAALGERNGKAILKNSDIKEIFGLRSNGLTQPEIAKVFNVARSTINSVLN